MIDWLKITAITKSKGVGELPDMMSAKIWDFSTPFPPFCPHEELVYTIKFTQPPLLRLRFHFPPTPSDADIISGSSLAPRVGRERRSTLTSRGASARGQSSSFTPFSKDLIRRSVGATSKNFSFCQGPSTCFS